MRKQPEPLRLREFFGDCRRPLRSISGCGMSCGERLRDVFAGQAMDLMHKHTKQTRHDLELYGRELAHALSPVPGPKLRCGSMSESSLKNPGLRALSKKANVREESVGFTSSATWFVREHELRHPCQVSCAEGRLVKRSLGQG